MIQALRHLPLLCLLLLPSLLRAEAEADLLVGYDQTHASSVGGSDNAQVLAANAIAGCNAIYERSGAGARVRIVGYHQAAQYSYQRTSNSGFVGWMSGYDSRLADVTHAADAKGADLVTFICDSTDDGAAAVAQQPGRFSSFDSSQFWSTVVAHELGGHNYGCDHRGGRLSPKTVMMHNYCGGGAQGYFSNPNMWLSGTRLIGEGSCLGTAVSGGNNALVIANAAQGVSDRNTRVNVAPNLSNVVRHWKLNQPAATAPSGTTITDAISGTALATVQGAGASFSGSGLVLPGGASGSGAAYLALPSTLISGYTNVTLEIWAKTLSVQNWARLLDFNSGTTNYLTLIASVGTNLSAQRFESMTAGTATTLDSGLPTAAGALHHYTIVYASTGASTGRWTWYRDGDAVAWLDVAYPLSAFTDVNNWLGRSAYSADSFAHCEYQEVRISNVAMTRDEVLSNYELGPNRVATQVYLSAEDALGTSSFNTAGNWSDALLPSAGKTYETYNFRLRTPADTSSRTFAGQTLKMTGGSLTWKGTGSSSVTINDFILNGDCEVLNAGSGTFTLAGSLSANTDRAILRAANGQIHLTANLTGSGPLLCVNNAVTLAGNNTAYAGKIIVGDGRSSSLTITDEAKLGPNPSALTTDQLSFNRGSLNTSGSLVLDDANRGLLFDVNGGSFNVASGGTLTVSCPLYSPELGTSLIVGYLGKSGAGTLILSSTNTNFKGSLHVDSGSATADDGILRVTNNQALSNAHNPIFINNTGTGSSRLQLQPSSGSITLTRVQLAGRNGTTPAIHNVSGSNTIGGITTMSGGSNHIVQCDAGQLSFSGGIYSGQTGNPNLTFQGSGDITTLSTISELTADTFSITKAGNGKLTLAGVCSHDGTTTLSGGTLRLSGSITGTGSMTTAAGTTFTGTGSSSAATTISGTHSPGDTAGTQTFSSTLAYTASSRLSWHLGDSTTATSSFNQVSAQSVAITSGAAVNLFFNDASSTVNFTSAFWSTPRSWPIMTATGITGQFALGTISTDAGGRSISTYGSFSLQQSSTSVTLYYYPLGSAPPSAPTALSALGLPSQISLSWALSSGAATYQVKRSTTSGGPYTTIASGITSTSYTDSSAEDSTTYYYVVTAVNPFGESIESAETSSAAHLPAVLDKADNTLSLNVPASWAANLLPNSYDTARWSGLAAANSVSLGSALSLRGISIGSTGGAVSITAGSTLSLGTAGIDMSSATQNLSIASGLTLGMGSQSWAIATGRSLTLTGSFTRSSGAALLVDKSSATGSVTASLPVTNSIVAPWAIIRSSGTAANNSAAGFTYATVTTGAVVPYTAATASGFNWTSSNANTFNYDISGTVANLGVARSANTVRYTGAAATQNYGSNNTTALTTNGLMNAGTGTLTLSQAGGSSLGQVMIGTNNGNELDLVAGSAGITLLIPIVNNGSTAGSVLIAGPNIVALDAASTYTGGTTLVSGELQLGNDAAVGSSSLTLAGGTLSARTANRTLANAISIAGDFTLGGSLSLTFSGPISLTNGRREVTVLAPTILSGILSSGALAKLGSGSLTLSGANSYAGGTTLSAGSLRITHAAGLGASSGSLKIHGGTLDLNAISPTVGTLSGSGGVITSLTSGTATLITNSASSSTYAGALQNGAAGQLLALTKQGSGNLTLTGSSSHSGPTMISAGTLTLNGSFTGGSAISISSTATLAGSGSSSGAVSVASGGSIAPSGTLTLSTLTLSSGSILHMQLATVSSSSKVSIGSSLSASGTTTVHVSALSGFGPGVYPLITGAGNVSTANFALGTTPVGYSYALSTSAGTLYLTVAAPLPAPTGLAVSVQGAALSLTWNAVSGAGTYTIKRSLTAGSGYTTLASGITATSYTDTSVTGGSTYYYAVSAVNLAGESEDSLEDSATALSPVDAWRLQHFGTTDNTGSAADSADADHDNVENLMEYATAMDTTTHDTVPTALSKPANTLEFVFTQNKAATDVTLQVEWSDELTSGSWSTASITLLLLSDNGSTQQWKATLPAGGAQRRFVRLRVTRP